MRASPLVWIVATIHAVALQSDGKVLAAHDNGLTRLNSDGSLDTSFILPSLLEADLSSVGLLSMAVQPDDKILIGGTNSWSPVAEAAVSMGDQLTVTVPTTAPRKFFRLKSQ